MVIGLCLMVVGVQVGLKTFVGEWNFDWLLHVPLLQVQLASMLVRTNKLLVSVSQIIWFEVELLTHSIGVDMFAFKFCSFIYHFHEFTSSDKVIFSIFLWQIHERINVLGTFDQNMWCVRFQKASLTRAPCAKSSLYISLMQFLLWILNIWLVRIV